MLGLADYKPKRKLIVVDDEIEFEVRGLSLRDVTQVFEFHKGAIDDIYTKLQARQGLEWSEAVMVETIQGVIESTPGVAATIIALAADSLTADTINNAASLPLPIQADALMAIGELTFKDLAGAKKFIVAVKDILRDLIPVAEKTATEKLPV